MVLFHLEEELWVAESGRKEDFEQKKKLRLVGAAATVIIA